MNVSFPTHPRPQRTTQNWVRTDIFNPPTPAHSISSCMRRKLTRSTKRKQILKGIIDSFPTHPRPQRTTQNWVRTDLFNPPTPSHSISSLTRQKLTPLTKRKQILKGMINSFPTHPRLLRMAVTISGDKL